MPDLSSPEQRAILDAILDQLIPPNRERDIPGAGEFGVADFIARVAQQNTEFEAAVEMLLTAVSGPADDISPNVVRHLEDSQPEAFLALLSETYKGYYSRPEIRPKFGVGAHPVHPEGYDVPKETPELLDELTAPVRARGKVFRDTRPAGGRE